MKIFLDDVRNAPNLDWVTVRNYDDCITILSCCWSFIKEISFDHDLGEDRTGYDVAKWIEEHCHMNACKCPTWRVHSANPVGRQNIEMAMKSAEIYR